MLLNACLLAKIGADTAENERNLPKICQRLATTRGRRRGLPARDQGRGDLGLRLADGGHGDDGRAPAGV